MAGYFNEKWYNQEYDIDDPHLHFNNILFNKDKYLSHTKITTINKANGVFSLLKTRFEELDSDYRSINGKLKDKLTEKYSHSYMNLRKQKNINWRERINVITTMQSLTDLINNIKKRVMQYEKIIKQLLKYDIMTKFDMDTLEIKAHLDVDNVSLDDIYKIEFQLKQYFGNVLSDMFDEECNEEKYDSENDDDVEDEDEDEDRDRIYIEI